MKQDLPKKILRLSSLTSEKEKLNGEVSQKQKLIEEISKNLESIDKSFAGSTANLNQLKIQEDELISKISALEKTGEELRQNNQQEQSKSSEIKKRTGIS